MAMMAMLIDDGDKRRYIQSGLYDLLFDLGIGKGDQFQQPIDIWGIIDWCIWELQ